MVCLAAPGPGEPLGGGLRNFAGSQRMERPLIVNIRIRDYDAEVSKAPAAQDAETRSPRSTRLQTDCRFPSLAPNCGLRQNPAPKKSVGFSRKAAQKPADVS
ncbi:hypothetical protein AGIG_G25287 [Arapaima gigas]